MLTSLASLAAPAASAGQADAPLSFGVVNQRSAVLTAQYWNPILRYVSQKSGIPLQLKLAKNGQEHAAMIRRGEFAFIYSNHQFSPENSLVGYTVIARPLESTIRGEIIVPADSPLQSLNQLHDREVVFPSKAAFIGYEVPMEALQRAGIAVRPKFAGTQEGALGQLLAGRAPAAGVNAAIARDYAARRNATYRVLWSSAEYPGIPIAAHPSLARPTVDAVRSALQNMANDPQGEKILAASGQLLQQEPPYGFTAASDADFEQIRQFYRNKAASASRP